MAKKTILLIVVLLVAALTYLGTNSLVFEKEVKKTISATPPPTNSSFPMTLSVFPNVIKAVPLTQSSADIILDTQAVPPGIIQLEIAYDPRVLTDMHISPGTFANMQTITLNNINYQTGRITYAIQLPDQKLPETKGSVARINFSVRPETTASQTTIYFLPKTAIQTREGNNGLSAAYGATVLIAPPANIPTNTPTGAQH